MRKASARAEAQDTMYTRTREKGKVIVVAATALYSTVQHTNGYRQPEERVRERGSARATVSLDGDAASENSANDADSNKSNDWTAVQELRNRDTTKIIKKRKEPKNLDTIREMIQRAKKERADKAHCGNEMK